LTTRSNPMSSQETTPHPQPHQAQSHQGRGLTALLVAGDVLALVIFVVLGRISHGFTSDWLLNLARILTPFLLGWFIAAWLAGAYRTEFVTQPTVFLGRTGVSWLIGIPLGLLFRRVLFQNSVALSFALTTLIFTALFLIGWRAILVWRLNRR